MILWKMIPSKNPFSARSMKFLVVVGALSSNSSMEKEPRFVVKSAAQVLVAGRLTYVYNYLGIERIMLTSTEEVPTGKSELSMKFTKTGNFEGDAEIFIDGKSVGKAHLAKTVPATFSIEETFDVGEDTGSPIIEDVYAVPFRNEALQKLTVKRSDD